MILLHHGSVRLLKVLWMLRLSLNHFEIGLLHQLCECIISMYVMLDLLAVAHHQVECWFNYALSRCQAGYVRSGQLQVCPHKLVQGKLASVEVPIHIRLVEVLMAKLHQGLGCLDYFLLREGKVTEWKIWRKRGGCRWSQRGRILFDQGIVHFCPVSEVIGPL